MKPSLRFEGGEELQAALLELEGAFAKKLVQDSLVDALLPVEQTAVFNAPMLTGALKRSIGRGKKLSKRQKRLNVPLAAVEAFVGPGLADAKGARHAHLLEFGTSRMAPHPFMRRSWTQNIQKVFDLLAGYMRARLAAAAAKAARKALRQKK